MFKKSHKANNSQKQHVRKITRETNNTYKQVPSAIGAARGGREARGGWGTCVTGRQIGTDLCGAK